MPHIWSKFHFISFPALPYQHHLSLLFCINIELSMDPVSNVLGLGVNLMSALLNTTFLDKTTKDERSFSLQIFLQIADIFAIGCRFAAVQHTSRFCCLHWKLLVAYCCK